MDDEYQGLLRLLTCTEKYFKEIRVDPSLLHSYKHLLRYLRSQPVENIQKILGSPIRTSEKSERESDPEFAGQTLSEMPFEKVLDLASNPSTSRKLLERIATERFSVTRGGLSALRTRDALVEKLRTLVGNETAHGSITRAVGQQL